MKKSKSIVKIEKIENLVSPEWEKQEGESDIWYQRFFLYYLGQIGKRSIRRGVLTWAKAEGVTSEAEIKLKYNEWREIAERNLWLEREIAFEEFQSKLITSQEYDVLERFKNQGLRLSENGMSNARSAVQASGEVFREFIETVPRVNGKIDFEQFDEAKYSKIITAMKTSADTANTFIEIGNKMLALDRVLEELLNNGEVIEAKLEDSEWEG
jgi:hypothetical protein